MASLRYFRIGYAPNNGWRATAYQDAGSRAWLERCRCEKLNMTHTQLPPPNEDDREQALQAILHIDNLRTLGRFSDQDTKQAEINYLAHMLRNARLWGRLREAVLSVVTPENVSLGHTWLRRKIIQVLEKSEQDDPHS